MTAHGLASARVPGTQHRLARQAGAALLAFATAMALLVLPASPAAAHNSIVSTVPAEGSTITEQPEAIRVTTSDTLVDMQSSTVIEISGPNGATRYYGDGCARVDGASAETTAALGAPGEYTVNWRVVSTDGHPTTGSYAFQWNPAEGVERAGGATSPPACGGAPTDDSSQDALDAEDSVASSDLAAPLTNLVWIGGALLAVLAAVGATMAIVRRRPSSRQPEGERRTNE